MRYGKRLPLALGLLVSLLAAGASAVSWQGYTLREWWRERESGEVLYHKRTQARVIALTFDDGPDPRFTPRVLAILNRFGVKATFFQEGKQIVAYPELAWQVAAEGHLCGNHTYSHPYLNRLPPRKVRAEIADCDACLREHLRLRTHLFRPPRGLITPAIFREAQRADERIILWTVALEHHDVSTPQAMAARALRLLRPGGILLLHDGGPGRESTVQALPLLLEGLRARGYRVVTVPKLLHIRGDETCPSPNPPGNFWSLL